MCRIAYTLSLFLYWFLLLAYSTTLSGLTLLTCMSNSSSNCVCGGLSNVLWPVFFAMVLWLASTLGPALQCFKAGYVTSFFLVLSYVPKIRQERRQNGEKKEIGKSPAVSYQIENFEQKRKCSITAVLRKSYSSFTGEWRVPHYRLFMLSEIGGYQAFLLIPI